MYSNRFAVVFPLIRLIALDTFPQGGKAVGFADEKNIGGNNSAGNLIKQKPPLEKIRLPLEGKLSPLDD